MPMDDFPAVYTGTAGVFTYVIKHFGKGTSCGELLFVKASRNRKTGRKRVVKALLHFRGNKRQEKSGRKNPGAGRQGKLGHVLY